MSKRRFTSKQETPPPHTPVASKEVLLGSSGGGATSAGWHAIEAFLRCPKEYQLKAVRGIYEPKDSTPNHFAVGGLLHAGRAQWFADRFATDEAAMQRMKEAVEKEAEIAKLPVSLDAVHKTLYLLHHYVEHWSRRPRPQPIACEYLLGPSPLLEGHAKELYRTARLDDVGIYPEAGNRLALGECKTTSTSIADCENQYDLHGQPLLQLALWATSANGEAQHGPAAGYVLDIIVKKYAKSGTKLEKPDFGRVFKRVPAFIMQSFIDSMEKYVRAASAVEWDTDVPRNTYMCTRLAGRARVPCEYRELCKHGRAASLKYVMGKGESLTRHVPTPGKERMPWE